MILNLAKYLFPLLLCGSAGAVAAAENVLAHTDLSGSWVVNEDLSDDTDKQVEKAIKASGGRPDSGGKRGKGRYKGGPPEQAIYDHIAYDEKLVIQQAEPEFRFVYPDGFERLFYTDGRSRTVSASGAHVVDTDFSFASWEGEALYVESRPRDGGRMSETYTLLPGGTQLRMESTMQPLTFGGTVSVMRVYDREIAAD